MDIKQLARQLIFTGSLDSSLITPDNKQEVIEILSQFDLSLTLQGDLYLAYSFSPSPAPILSMNSSKYLRSIITMAPYAVVLASDIDPVLLTDLVRLKYGNLIRFSSNFPIGEKLAQKLSKSDVFAFGKRLFIETQTGEICDGCGELGGFMIECDCGKQYHMECAEIIKQCCQFSQWGGLEQLLYVK